MTNPICESEYDFTLLLNGVSEITDDIERSLYEAGCDDATISVRSGRMYLTFSRHAPSMKDAILSAVANIRDSQIGATVVRVDQCDLVSQSEIARRIDRTRQLVNQYISGQRGPGGFPGPACNIIDGAPLWYWCEVAYWLFENSIIKEDSLRDAQDLSVINSVLEFEFQRRLAPEVTKEILNELCPG